MLRDFFFSLFTRNLVQLNAGIAFANSQEYSSVMLVIYGQTNLNFAVSTACITSLTSV